jgi:hypothetical protein
LTKYEYINRNIDHIKLDVKLGIVSYTVIRHWEIYCRFDYYRKLNNPISDAAINAGDDFKISETQIFRIKKDMESEI